jgi:type VI secretion system protein ImpK
MKDAFELASDNQDAWQDQQAAGDPLSVLDAARERQAIFPPGPNHDERLAEVRLAQTQGRNALLVAARELLRALAEMPHDIQPEQAKALRDLLAQELHSFTRLCEQANIRREHLLAVRYVLCTALDEAASLTPWNGTSTAESAGPWSSMALLPEFHGEGQGGQVVFLLVGRLASSPDEHMPVLEVVHHVLSLGFMGDYRVQPDGHRLLETIRHRLHALVSGSREPVARELSPRWQGVAQGKFQLLRSVPVWVSACVLGLVLLGQFGWSKYQLLSTAGDVQKRIEALQRLQPPPVTVKAPLRLAELLATEVAQGRVQVSDEPGRSVVLFKGDGMFAGGLAQLSPAARQTIEKVADAINDVTGQVVVTGHTDNQPLGSGRAVFADNQALSLKRAQEVVAVLKARGVDQQRIEVVGKGETEPLAGNDTPAGRAQNRRVQIEVKPSAKP